MTNINQETDSTTCFMPCLLWILCQAAVAHVGTSARDMNCLKFHLMSTQNEGEAEREGGRMERKREGRVEKLFNGVKS